MGKITKALKKAADERMDRLDKVVKMQEREKLIVHKMKESHVDARLVAYFDPKSVISEQYKTLTTNLQSINKSKPNKLLAITSSINGEGKTVTALNLAVTLAHAVKKPKVLLIDADMRKGKMAHYLGVNQEKGLSNVLQGEANMEDVLFGLEDIDNLSFMACGPVPPNPAELLADDAMKKLLHHVKAQFDYVLIDTPPVIAVTDPGLIGASVDGVLMVIQAGRTQRGVITRAKELLYQAHAKVIGHVLTGIEYYLPQYIYRYL